MQVLRTVIVVVALAAAAVHAQPGGMGQGGGGQGGGGQGGRPTCDPACGDGQQCIPGPPPARGQRPTMQCVATCNADTDCETGSSCIIRGELPSTRRLLSVGDSP